MSEVRTDKALSMLSANPKQTALLLDVDGTLAPIVNNPVDASVPVEVRTTLIELGRRFGLVACISGRQADEARRIVGAGGLTYIGGHGSERLLPGATEPEVDNALAPWSERVNAVAAAAARDLSALGIRREDKGAVAALHYRGVADEDQAAEALELVAARASADGLAIHWGRKVLELRPPVPFNKGIAVTELIEGGSFETVLYAGDDRTDLDSFDALDSLLENGKLKQVLKLGVLSSEAPPEIGRASDLVVTGTDGVAEFLGRLLAVSDK